MKMIYTLSMSIIVSALGIISPTSLFAQYSGGAGTVGNPWQIATTDDLITLSNSSSDWGDYFIQTTDIVFLIDEQTVDWDGDGDANWDVQDQLGFSPIGNSTNFTGHYDGQDFWIINLFINRTSQDFVGLFGILNGANIENIGLTNARIYGQNLVGGLIGYQISGTVSNCFFKGIVDGINNLGGLIGASEGNVVNSYSEGSVSGEEQVGGLIGTNEGNVANSYSSGSVSGDHYVGGLVGYNFIGEVSYCYSVGSINGNNYIGGLIGANEGNVANCYSTGSVTGQNNVGGLVGASEGNVVNSYSSGSVSGEEQVGGLIGANEGNVANSYSSGSVSGNYYFGGLVGANDGTVSNCYWDTETSGQENSDGGMGKDTDEMKTKSTFTDATWDFDIIWNINNIKNDGYPYLRVFNRIFVDVSATGSNNGKNWRNAYNSLQDALFYSSIGDEIWVAAGTYKPSFDYFLEIGNRGKHFRMNNGVEIYGGFAGTENLRSERNISANLTILSGDLNGDDGPNWANRNDNCYHIFYHSEDWSLDETSILDGFTITGGNANGTAPHNRGGGIYNHSNSPTIQNCNITKNNATWAGGGVYNYYPYYPTLINCNIIENKANWFGGGIFIGEYSYTSLTNCKIYNNNADYGSGVYNNISSPTLTNCLISGNDGYMGGGVNNNNSSPTLTNCTIFGNNAVFGGGVSHSNNTTITFNNCIIWGNTASGFGNHGKQFYFSGGTTTLNYSSYSNGTNHVYLSGGTFTATNNNITLNPLFTDPVNGDLRLSGVSPAVDAGNNSYNSEDFDIRGEGFPRKLDKSDHTQAGTIDMGAYEYKEGADPLGCFSEVYISDEYDSNTPGWQVTHHDNLSYALTIACDDATINISNYAHSGDVDMTGYTFIIGDYDFNLDGNLTGGLIQTPSTGRLILPAVQNVQQDYPMSDGNNNYTLKIICENIPTNPIRVRLKEQSVPGAIKDPMQFWEIEGDDNLNATIIFRIDKSAIAPKTLNTNSILRFYDGEKYLPMTENQVTINDKGLYYEIIIINVNQF
jgi:hypothetical protein